MCRPNLMDFFFVLRCVWNIFCVLVRVTVQGNEPVGMQYLLRVSKM
jgi:hypothetical protein